MASFQIIPDSNRGNKILCTNITSRPARPSTRPRTCPGPLPTAAAPYPCSWPNPAIIHPPTAPNGCSVQLLLYPLQLQWFTPPCTPLPPPPTHLHLACMHASPTCSLPTQLHHCLRQHAPTRLPWPPVDYTCSPAVQLIPPCTPPPAPTASTPFHHSTA